MSLTAKRLAGWSSALGIAFVAAACGGDTSDAFSNGGTSSSSGGKSGTSAGGSGAAGGAGGAGADGGAGAASGAGGDGASAGMAGAGAAAGAGAVAGAGAATGAGGGSGVDGGPAGAGGVTGGSGSTGVGGAAGGSGGVGGRLGSGGIGGIAGKGGSGGAADCNALQRDVLAKLAAAQQCCPGCDALQCQAIVAGMCCPALVNRADSPQTQAYQVALKAFMAECDIVCPDVLCKQPQIGNCVAGPAGGGSCR
jgi:hypothetical protein